MDVLAEDVPPVEDAGREDDPLEEEDPEENALLAKPLDEVCRDDDPTALVPEDAGFTALELWGCALDPLLPSELPMVPEEELPPIMLVAAADDEAT